MFKIYDKQLSGILDIERLNRRISLSMLQPSEFYMIDQSYTQISDVIQQIKTNR